MSSENGDGVGIRSRLAETPYDDYEYRTVPCPYGPLDRTVRVPDMDPLPSSALSLFILVYFKIG